MAAGVRKRTLGSNVVARSLAATSTAGASRKSSVASDCASSDSTSPRNASSPPQAFSMNDALALASRSNAEWYTNSIFRQRSGSTYVPPAELTPQPALCQLPVSLHRLRRDFQYLGSFLYAHPAEKAQLDNL